MPDDTNTSDFSTPSSEATAQGPNMAVLQPFTPSMPGKRGETIEELFKLLPPHSKPGCVTNLQEDETIDEAISRITTSEGMYKMYCLLVQKAQMADQGTAHQKMLSQKGRVAVDKALPLLAEELNIERGWMAHMLANSAAERRNRAIMQCEEKLQIMQDKSDIVIKLQQELQKAWAAMHCDEQLQIKSDVIIKLQRELQEEIQDYKLGSREDLLTVLDLAIPKHNRGAGRQFEDEVLWERVPPGPGVPHTMVTNKGKLRHWCPHHHKWTQHTPEECRVQPVLDGHHWMAPNGVQRDNS